MLTRLIVCAAMAVARLAELVYSRRNMAQSGPSDEGPWSRRTYPLIVLVHTAAIAGTVLRGRNRPDWRWLALLLAAQPLRLWVLGSLRSRWNTRAAVPSDATVETGGPYAWIRHPNYLVIFIELLSLPLAFGMRGLALTVTAANAALLALRIPEEEAALMKLPGYRAHFGRKARFIPRIF